MQKHRDTFIIQPILENVYSLAKVAHLQPAKQIRISNCQMRGTHRRGASHRQEWQNHWRASKDIRIPIDPISSQIHWGSQHNSCLSPRPQQASETQTIPHSNYQSICPSNQGASQRPCDPFILSLITMVWIQEVLRPTTAHSVIATISQE